jgi:azurin
MKKALIYTVLLLAGFAFASPLYAQDKKTVEVKGLDSMTFSKEKITAKPGQKIRVKFIMESDMPPSAMKHNIVFLKSSTDTEAFVEASMQAADNDYIAPGKSDAIIARSEMLGGGKTETITFTAPDEPGEYEYVCTFPGHFSAGMKGVLKVK